MAKRPPEDGLVTNAADAARVGDVLRLLPMVLLRDVPAVQAAFAAWQARMIHEEATSGITPEAIDRAVVDDLLQLTMLVRDLGIERYRWLPMMLRVEFQRVAEHADRLEVTLPPELQWAERKPNPKQHAGPKEEGGSRLEDLERNMTWFVACKVLGTPVRGFANKHHVPRTTVDSAIKRVEVLLDCIHRPLPNPHVS